MLIAPSPSSMIGAGLSGGMMNRLHDLVRIPDLQRSLVLLLFLPVFTLPPVYAQDPQAASTPISPPPAAARLEPPASPPNVKGKVGENAQVVSAEGLGAGGSNLEGTGEESTQMSTQAGVGTAGSDMEEVLQEAQSTQAYTQNQVTTILSMMEVFLGFLSLVLTIAGVIGGVLGFLGFRGVREMREEAKNVLGKIRSEAGNTLHEAQELMKVAEHTRQRVEEAKQAAEASSQNIIALEASLSNAFGGRIRVYLEMLPPLESEEIVGVSQEKSLPPEVSTDFEDRDILLMICDQLGIKGDREKVAENFLRLARYWRLVKNYPRALARVERAVDLNPQSPIAHRDLARTLAHWSAQSRLSAAREPGIWAQRLQRALDELKRAQELAGRDDDPTVLFEFAWTLDEMQEFDQASTYYQRAREEDRKAAATQGRKEYWYFTYNLACSLSRAKRFEEALAELSFFLERWPKRWEAVIEDPDFAELRHSSWGEKLKALIEDAQKQPT